MRSTIITFSARSLTDSASAARAPSARGAVPLIGSVRTSRPRRRKKSSGERLQRAPQGPPTKAAWRGASAPRRAREQVGGVALEARVEAQADIRLEDLTGRDPLAAGLDRREMPGRAGRRGPEAADPHRPLAHACREPPCESLAALAQRAVALLGPERLEPPAPVRVEPQQMVVEAEHEVGQRGGPRRRGRHRLEPGAEPVAEIAEPATSDGPRLAGRLELGLHVEQRERVVGRVRHDKRLGADECATARPGAGQREGPDVAPDQERRAIRGHAAPERDPKEPGAAGRAHARSDCTYLSFGHELMPQSAAWSGRAPSMLSSMPRRTRCGSSSVIPISIPDGGPT